MVAINVSINGISQFRRTLNGLPNQVNTKCQQALNRTLQRSRTQMTNAIGEKLNLRKKAIRELVSIQRGNNNTGLIGKLSVKHKPVPLMEYNAKQNRKGVSFRVFKDRSRQWIKSAFICPDRHSRLTVFKRETVARLRIKPLYGTSVMYVAKDKLNIVKNFALEFLKTETKRLLISKLKA